MPNITPIISVCIPVYHTEHLLEKCLASVAAQKPVAEKIVPQFEIVIVNDGSTGRDEQGRDCERIIKDFEKSLGKKRDTNNQKSRLFSFLRGKQNASPAEKQPPEDASPFAKTSASSEKITHIKYISHGKNRGLVEARRTLVEAASGDYICMLDSDDTLTENALAFLYDAAVTSQANIVHGKAKVINSVPEDAPSSLKERAEKRVRAIDKKVNNVHEGFLHGSEILDGHLIAKNHVGMLWGKLIRRELYLEAFSHIPNIFCTMADDVLQYFWITFEAESYFGFDAKVYNYSVGTGISSDVIINDLERWSQVCSASSVFTALFTETENLPPESFSDAEKKAMNNLYHFHIYDNLQQLQFAVADEIKTDAYEMLCDFWGTENVERVERDMGSRQQN